MAWQVVILDGFRARGAVDVQLSIQDCFGIHPSLFTLRKNRYIATRTPVVLRGLPEYLGCTAQWTNSYLRSAAGKVEVTVEKRYCTVHHAILVLSSH